MKQQEMAYFAGGCFWCITPTFRELAGVSEVVSGYCGGREEDPAYADVKNQKTGHRETIRITFDPEQVRFGALLAVFLGSVDPFDGGGQFIDRGHSYTLAVYYTSEAQRAAAQAAIRQLEADSGKPVCIRLEPFEKFYLAEEYHQNYDRKHPAEFRRELIASGRQKSCDLHAHSYYSDGTDSPAQLLAEAKRMGLSAVALTDHNTVAGLPEFMAAGQGSGVEAVPGCEFSTDWQGTELHILGLDIRPEHYETVTALLEEAQREKARSSQALVAALNAAGYALDYAEICSRSSGQINRSHIASALVEKGYFADKQAAFRGPLSCEHGFYQPPKRIDAYDCIRFIKSIGAVAVLAHPLLTLEEPALRAFLPQAVEAGLDAMEVAYSKYSPETTARAFAIADEFGLQYSGGSDHHGGNKPDITLGIGRGDLAVPAQWLDALR